MPTMSATTVSTREPAATPPASQPSLPMPSLPLRRPIRLLRASGPDPCRLALDLLMLTDAMAAGGAPASRQLGERLRDAVFSLLVSLSEARLAPARELRRRHLDAALRTAVDAAAASAGASDETPAHAEIRELLLELRDELARGAARGSRRQRR